MPLLVVRLLTLVAFAVLGVVWSADPDDTTAALWVVSFVLVVVAALQPAEKR